MKTTNIVSHNPSEINPSFKNNRSLDVIALRDLTSGTDSKLLFSDDGEYKILSTIYGLINSNRSAFNKYDFLDNTIGRNNGNGIIHFCNVLEVDITGKGGGINPGIKGIGSYLTRQGAILGKKDAIIVNKSVAPMYKENIAYLRQKGLRVLPEDNVFAVDVDEESTTITDLGLWELKKQLEERKYNGLSNLRFLPFYHSESMSDVAREMGFEYKSNPRATKQLCDKFYVLKELEKHSVKTIYGKEINRIDDIERVLSDNLIRANKNLAVKLRDGASGLGIKFVKNDYGEVLKAVCMLGEVDENGKLKYPVRIEECVSAVSSPSSALYVDENRITYIGCSNQFFEHNTEDGEEMPAKEHMGNWGPSFAEGKIKEVSIKVAEFARKHEYNGFLGIDLLITKNEMDEIEVRVAEINPRLGGPSTAYRIAYDHPISKKTFTPYTCKGFGGGNLDLSLENSQKSIEELDYDITSLISDFSKNIIVVITNSPPIKEGRIQIALLGDCANDVRDAYQKIQSSFSPNHKATLAKY